jgi:hypothetical protein
VSKLQAIHLSADEMVINLLFDWPSFRLELPQPRLELPQQVKLTFHRRRRETSPFILRTPKHFLAKLNKELFERCVIVRAATCSCQVAFRSS